MLRLSRLSCLLELREPIVIDHQDIAWKCMENPPLKVDARYARCNPGHPGILVRGAVNPHGKPFRMIDGSHRMARMTLESGIECSPFYVLSHGEFLEFLEDFSARR